MSNLLTLNKNYHLHCVVTQVLGRSLLSRLHHYRPPTKLREGTVVSDVCLSTRVGPCDHYSWCHWSLHRTGSPTHGPSPGPSPSQHTGTPDPLTIQRPLSPSYGNTSQLGSGSTGPCPGYVQTWFSLPVGKWAVGIRLKYLLVLHTSKPVNRNASFIFTGLFFLINDPWQTQFGAVL